MEEKIKVNVTARTAEILEKDAEAFEFFKKDGRSLNKNAFITKLIVNYSEKFRKRQAELLLMVRDKAAEYVRMDEVRLEHMCRALAAGLNKREAAPFGEKFDKVVAVKPTKESAPVIAYAEKYEMKGSSLSEYFRNMFSSYAALPQDEREKIIFMPQYVALMEAIKAKKQVFVTTSHARQKQVAPYAFACSKEELHCYLLGTADKGACVPLRLSRVVSVVRLEEDAVFDKEQVAMFARMTAFGPQFSYGKAETTAAVRLTERGKSMFTALYVHRPVPVKTEGDMFYFDCSHMQLAQYFVRFGKEAFVVEPLELRRRIKRFFLAGLKSYNEGEKSFSAAEEERSGERAPLRRAVKKPELAGSEKKERLAAGGEDKKRQTSAGAGAERERGGAAVKARCAAERSAGNAKRAGAKGGARAGKKKFAGVRVAGKGGYRRKTSKKR